MDDDDDGGGGSCEVGFTPQPFHYFQSHLLLSTPTRTHTHLHFKSPSEIDTRLRQRK